MSVRLPTEAQALRHIRRAWKAAGHSVLIQPIETSTGVGVPDLYLWIAESHQAWWCELKRGRRRTTLAQTRWLMAAERLGQKVCVLRVWQDYRFTVHRPNEANSVGKVFQVDTLYALLAYGRL